MAGIDSLMVTGMITATPTETLASVVRRMSQNRIGAVLVVDNGILRGLFSERDLLTRVVQANRDPQATWVGQVATTELSTVDVSTPLKEVLQLFRQKKFRHLPVMRGTQPVGILSTRDFLDYLVEGLEQYIDRLKYQRELTEGVDPYDHLGGSYGK